MEVRPGYKQTEVGVIPEAWGVKRLGELGRVVRGGSPRPAGDPRYFNGNFIPWLTVGSLTNIPTHQIFVTDTADQLTAEGAEWSRTLSHGTLVLVNSGARTLGVAKVLGLTCCANDGIAALLNQTDGDKRFLCYYLNTQTKRLREVVAAGNDQLNLNTARIAGIAVPFPEGPEQQAIATALGDVDALITSLDLLIAKKRDLKQAVMQQLLTSKTRLPGFHDAWGEPTPFGKLAVPRKQRMDPTQGDGHPFCIELEHIEPVSGRLIGHTKAGDRASMKTVFQRGDVLFGKLRAYLRKYWLATREGVCTTEIWALTPTAHLVDSRFLLHVITTDQFINTASTAYGTHMPRSDWNVVKRFPVLLPSLPEQVAIAEVLSDMDAEIAALEDRRDKTRLLKEGMAQELLTGRTRLV